MKRYAKSPLPSSLKSVPKGYVYLGKGGEFKTDGKDFRGYGLYDDRDFNRGPQRFPLNGRSPNFYYFAPANSEIARLNGLGPRKRKVAPKVAPAPKITPLPSSLKTPKGFVYLGKGGEFERPDDKGFDGDCAKLANGSDKIGCGLRMDGDVCNVAGDRTDWFYFAKADSPVAILNGHRPAPVVPLAPPRPKKATIGEVWDAFKTYAVSSAGQRGGHPYLCICGDGSGGVEEGVSRKRTFSFGGLDDALATIKAATK